LVAARQRRHRQRSRGQGDLRRRGGGRVP
jgi:hypothetical protein